MEEEETPTSWALHFRDEPFSSTDRRVKLIERLCVFLLKPAGWQVLSQATADLHLTLVVPIDFEQLCNVSEIDELRPAVELQPQECLGCLAAAVFEVRWRKSYRHSSYQTCEYFDKHSRFPVQSPRMFCGLHMVSKLA